MIAKTNSIKSVAVSLTRNEVGKVGSAPQRQVMLDASYHIPGDPALYPGLQLPSGEKGEKIHEVRRSLWDGLQTIDHLTEVSVRGCGGPAMQV